MAANPVLDQRRTEDCMINLDAQAVERDASRVREPHVLATVGPKAAKEKSLAAGSRVYRILQLINTMRSGETFTIDELVAKMKISRRTVFRDLEMLVQSGIPCCFDSRRRGYRISEWYFPPTLNLNLPEALALYIAAAKIVRSRAFPFATEALHAAEKVAQSLPPGLKSMCSRLAEVVDARWPAMVDTVGTRRIFQTLQEAAASRHQVQLAYDLYSEKRETGLLVRPYVLVLLERMWYLVAYVDDYRQVRTLNLDRILAADLLETTFPEPSDFSLDAYLGQAWSITPEGKIWSVRLRFSAQVAGDVEEIVWHKSQQTQRLPDGSLIFEVEVDGLSEITSWIMGFGDQVVVEKPTDLRSRIRQTTQNMLDQYAD